MKEGCMVEMGSSLLSNWQCSSSAPERHLRPTAILITPPPISFSFALSALVGHCSDGDGDCCSSLECFVRDSGGSQRFGRRRESVWEGEADDNDCGLRTLTACETNITSSHKDFHASKKLVTKMVQNWVALGEGHFDAVVMKQMRMSVI